MNRARQPMLQFFLPLFAAVGLLAVWPGCAGGGGSGNFTTVVIDAGHGGHDRGARAVSGMYEKQVALDTALRLERILQRRGYRVVMTRLNDTFIPLSRRVAISNGHRNAIFVSVHYNWARYRGAGGTETYYSTPQSARLAANIQRELARAYRTPDRGVKRRGFYVLRNNRRPAVLVECGFLSNPGDNAVAQSADGRQRIAEAIARGIENERRGRR